MLKNVLIEVDDIEKYKGCDLYVTRENAIPLEEGEAYLADIINSKVITEDGEEFGELVDILETGANLVFVVKHDGKEVLLPDIPDCVKEVDDNLANYRIPETARALQEFVDDMSNWYVRRSRERFWAKGMEQD